MYTDDVFASAMQNRLALLWNLLVVFCNFIYMNQLPALLPSVLNHMTLLLLLLLSALAICSCVSSHNVSLCCTQILKQSHINVQTQIML